MADDAPREPDLDSPHMLEIQERNSFYETLSIQARRRFLDALEEAKARGLDDEAAWREAVVAAETAYNRVDVDDPIMHPPEPPINRDSAQD